MLRLGWEENRKCLNGRDEKRRPSTASISSVCFIQHFSIYIKIFQCCMYRVGYRISEKGGGGGGVRVTDPQDPSGSAHGKSESCTIVK